MIAHEEMIAAFFNKVPEDEEVFILRAQDALAPQTIRYWARGLQQVNDSKGKMIEVDETHDDYDTIKNHNALYDARALKAQEALDLADRMDEYHTRKIPD